MEYPPKSEISPGTTNESTDWQSTPLLSTNIDYLKRLRINDFSPAGNLRRVTPPYKRKAGEYFEPWFMPDDELAQAVAIRKEAFANDPDKILQINGDSQTVYEAASQFLKLQVDELTSQYPELYAREGQLIVNKVTGDRFDPSDQHPLAISGLLGQEDICMVERAEDGRQVMVAAFVASPTDWTLSKLVGKDMDQIHKDVRGYFETVEGSNRPLKWVVDKTLDGLPDFSERQVTRNNVFLVFSPSYALVPGHFSETVPDSTDDPGSQIFLRSEYETLTRLPSTEEFPNGDKYIFFTIKPHTYPLSLVAEVRRDDMAEAMLTNMKLRRSEALAKLVISYLT